MMGVGQGIVVVRVIMVVAVDFDFKRTIDVGVCNNKTKHRKMGWDLRRRRIGKID